MDNSYQNPNPNDQLQPQPQPMTSEPEFNQPQKPRNTRLYFIVGLVILVGAAAYGGLWWWGKQNAEVAVPTFTPRPDPTANWQTYRNEEFGFEVKYPKDYQIDFEVFDQVNRLVVFVNNGQSFEVRLRPQIGPLASYNYLDLPADSQSILGSRPAVIYKAPNGYCDGLGCGDPFMSYVTDKNNYFYHLTFYGDAVLSELESQILSTFKFIEPTITTFQQCVEAGNPVMESFPEQCRAQDGVLFVNWRGAGQFCIQVITSARNLQTGEVRDFPTPCDVPEGWVTL